MTIDVRNLKAAELARTLNSTQLGPVINDRQLSALRTMAGLRIAGTNPSRVDLFRFAAWTVSARHEHASARRPALVSAAELARVMKVSAAAVGKWVERGCPVASIDAKTRARMFDMAAVTQWRAGWSGSGPKHNRTPGVTSDGQEPSTEQKAFEQAQKLKFTGEIDISTATAIIESFRAGTVTPTVARTGLETLRAANARVDLDKTLGRLVDAATFRDAVGAHLNVVRMTLDALPARLADLLIAAMDVPRERRPKIVDVITDAVDAAKRALAADPFAELQPAAAAG